eukprot:11493968-Alexandrium_andersonii.AAC.1
MYARSSDCRGQSRLRLGARRRVRCPPSAAEGSCTQRALMAATAWVQRRRRVKVGPPRNC